MPSSQLKQLKASLREHGITGPQKSKKQKKQSARPDARIKRDAALSDIHEKYNPFDTKTATRPNKRDVTTLATMRTAGKAAPTVYGRPGVTKSHGEELRKKSLLLEAQKRRKVGGILDRRIGEGDMNMTPEEKAQQRSAREIERKSRKHSLFDLDREGADEDEFLTHGGGPLEFGDGDDFDAGSMGASSSGEDDLASGLLKRKHESMEELSAITENNDEPQRKKSKAEVMKEVMAKSKLAKYERQQAKEDDEEVREQLDKGIGDLKQALFGFQIKIVKKKYAPMPIEKASSQIMSVDPGRAALMETRLDPDKDYDLQIKKLAQEKRAKVTDRSKTQEEREAEALEQQQKADDSRMRRMRGEEEDIETAQERNEEGEVADLPDGFGVDDAHAFGLDNSRVMERPPGFEDEDEFVIDEDLVASGSDVHESGLDAESVEDESGDEMLESDDGKSEHAEPPGNGVTGANQVAVSSNRLSDCPETFEDVVSLIENDLSESVQSLIRRVRVKYDPSFSTSNKPKLEAFALALVQYLSRRPNGPEAPPLATFESIIRHLQSMSRTFPDSIGKAFRMLLEKMHQESSMNAGDLMVLTAIGTMYPTSDHFHQVVTPAMTLMARWLALTRPRSSQQMATGVYLSTLALNYQSFSKRYIPEVVRFTVEALKADPPGDLKHQVLLNIRTMTDLWSSNSALVEILEPHLLPILQQQGHTKLLNHLTIHLNQAKAARQPLALHNHRPLPIPSRIPKFEENFNPDRHYDPDRARADETRLRKEYKREKKGAIRELRKDAQFLARYELQEKREKDKAYEEKYRRLVASIQGEEGREQKEYEREKAKRKRGR